MKHKHERALADRRSFLKLAGIGTVAGGVALVAGKEAAQAGVSDKPKDRLYRETEHVKTYYDLARR